MSKHAPAENEGTLPLGGQPANGTAAVRALIVLVAAHFLVDLFGGSVSPLWPVLEKRLSLQSGGVLWIFFLWSLATSLSQLAFGIWADRGRASWSIWLGPAVAVVCLSCLGGLASTAVVSVLLVLGGLGIAAFHPEAAARAGSILPTHRSRAMAFFSLGGYLGQAIGPIYSGVLTDHFGPPGLLWGIVWGTAALISLRLIWPPTPCPLALPPSPSRPAGSTTGRGWGRAAFLLLLGSLRVLPATGLTLALAYQLESQNATASAIGAVQSAFMAGIGVGGIVCAAVVSPRWERQILWLMPVAAAPFVAGLAFLQGPSLTLAVGLAGGLHGVGMPVFISSGQLLVPAGQRVASSITMGVSWGVAGGLAAVSLRCYQQANNVAGIFPFLAIISVLSGILCLCLPRPEPTDTR